MYRKPTKEKLAQQALDYLEQAERFENEMNWSKAMENYNNAAELLKQSGFLSHRIEDIYSRMTELNNQIQQEKSYQESQILTQQAQFNQLQDEAFTFLDEAKKFEEKGNFDDALKKYIEAIKLLVKAGWTESQLDKLKVKIMNLAQNLEILKQDQKKKEVVLSQQVPEDQIRSQTQRAGTLLPEIIDKKTEALKEYEKKRKEQEIMQNRAFALMEEAKKFEESKNFDRAIVNYQEAKDLLNSLGWELQTQNFQIIIDKLKREKDNYEKIQAQQQQQIYSIEEPYAIEPSMIISEAENKKLKIAEFEKQKRLEEKLKIKGFKLIDKGKRKADLKEFDKAYECFKKAISHFKEIEWNEQIHLIEKQINQTRALEKQFKQEELEVRKIQEELERRKKLEKERWKKEEQKMKQMISEVGNLADEIEGSIEIKKQELKLTEKQKLGQIRSEAKDFSRDLRKMIKLKQEIRAEIMKKEESSKKKQEVAQKAKDLKELDEISRMIKEVSEKKKK